MVPKRWQVQEAKGRFSALIAEAEHAGPQSITRHGRDVAVVMSADDFERLAARSAMPLVEFLASAPLAELDLPDRDRSDAGREIEL